MATDYESILRRAVDQLDRPDQAQRNDIYERARRTLSRHLGSADSHWSQENIDTQFEKLESAIAQIESGFSGTSPVWRSHPATERQDRRTAGTSRSLRPEAASPLRRWATVAVSTIAVVFLVSLGLYIAGSGENSKQPSTRQSGPTGPPTRAQGQKITAPTGVSAGPSYILRRQYVYYRTTHPVGAIIISRSQRFLYLVRPNQVAVRYAIGVGPECQTLAGLFHISQKVQQPEPNSPKSTSATTSRSDSKSEAGQLFGSRALYFGAERSVHGTSEPDSVGQQASFGCFHSWDNDIAELYERVRLNERVVVAN